MFCLEDDVSCKSVLDFLTDGIEYSDMSGSDLSEGTKVFMILMIMSFTVNCKHKVQHNNAKRVKRLVAFATKLISVYILCLVSCQFVGGRIKYL